MPGQGGTTSATRMISFLFATLAILGRVGYYISTPLWLDHFKGHNSSRGHNETDHNSTGEPHHGVSVFFLMITQSSIATLTFGAALVFILVFQPGKIGATEREFPFKYFLIVGVSQGVSSVLFNFALSGTRTAPYLQAILANCTIPIQFVIRSVTHIYYTCTHTHTLSLSLCLSVRVRMACIQQITEL